MKDGKWEDWTEPLEVLLSKVKEFIDTVKLVSSRLQELPEGGKLIELPELCTRHEALGKALSAFLSVPRRVWTADFLGNYIYAASVYEDVYGFVFEYIGESEHQMDLHGDEVPQTKLELLKDFALYVENWQSPHAKT